jgi:hypothetical protein
VTEKPCHRGTARTAVTHLLALLLAWASPALAQKTDVMVLYNGNTVTGEVKELSRGKLSYKTDDMGTLSVEWDKIAHLTSTNYFDVEDRYAGRYFGRLASDGTRGQLLVVLADTVRVRMIDVVAISRIEASFWSRLDGYVDVGLDLQRANANRKLSGAVQVAYRGERWASRLNGSAYFQNQEGSDPTSRNSVLLSGQRLFASRWSALAVGSLEQNEQLGLALRETIGIGAARDLVRTNRMTLYVAAVAGYANERYTNEEGSTNTVQLPMGGDFEFFVFDSPKTDISTDLTVTPILNDLGRWRIDFNARISYELISDFTVSLSGFDNYDSRPPATAASSNDYGLTFSLGYTF